MTADWLDRAALASERTVSRGTALKVLGAAALTFGPLGTLLRTAPAHGALSHAVDDCVYCVLTDNAKLRDSRLECAKFILSGLVSPAAGAIALVANVGCLAGSLLPPAETICQVECRRVPAPNGTGDSPTPWDFPPRKKSLRSKGKPSRGSAPSKSRHVPPPTEIPAADPCETCHYSCDPCAATDSGFICCALPKKTDGCSPCCPGCS